MKPLQFPLISTLLLFAVTGLLMFSLPLPNAPSPLSSVLKQM